MTSQRAQRVPEEIISNIFSFSNPLDVVRARLVSKTLRDTTYRSGLWKTLYANAPFPRPPGPFDFQSTEYLERVLVQSARLARSWTSKQLQESSSREISLKFKQNQPLRLFGGRWFLSCESSKKIALRDVSRPTFRQVIWEIQRGGEISSWESCSITSPEGEMVYIAVREKSRASQLAWKLLAFRANHDSGQMTVDFSFSVHIPGGDRSSRDYATVELRSGNTPFILLDKLHIIFDTRTRIFYKFPEFPRHVSTVEEPFENLNAYHVLLTNTHIIAVENVGTTWTQSPNVIRAFTVHPDPPQHPSGVRILPLTHQGSIDIARSLDPLPALIRNSIVDPLTGSTNMRFMRQSADTSGRLRISCVDVTLPASQDGAVLPISIDSHDVFKITGPFTPDDLLVHGRISSFIDASDDGHVRGFYRTHDDNVPNFGFATSMHFWTFKFTIDATKDKCEASVGKLLPQVERSHVEEIPYYASFDGARGRACYGTRARDMSNIYHYDTVHVVDLR